MGRGNQRKFFRMVPKSGNQSKEETSEKEELICDDFQV